MSKYTEVYTVKFKDVDFVKIGKSTDSISRCIKIGKIEWIVVVPHQHSDIMEGVFHNALAKYRVPRFVATCNGVSNDGSTEYFLMDCVESFKSLCDSLNLRYRENCFYNSKSVVNKKYDIFKEDLDFLADVFIAGYERAIFKYGSLDDHKEFLSKRKRLKKQLYQQTFTG